MLKWEIPNKFLSEGIRTSRIFKNSSVNELLMSNKKPNMVIFNSDELRSDAIGHLGNPAAVTPNFDAFLKDSVSFKSAFCQNPVCVWGVFTGRYSIKNLRSLLGGLGISRKICEHYENYPENPNDFEKWVLKAQELWSQLPKMNLSEIK